MRNTPIVAVRVVERAYLTQTLRGLMTVVEAAFDRASECGMPDTMVVLFCLMEDLVARLRTVRPEPELRVDAGGGEDGSAGLAPTMLVTPGEEPTPPETPVAIRQGLRHG